uniref:F-box/kelch-repeat protein n=1 Tax=Noccaea caerulescens TaxID=107243 RepID=A0A1J3INQ9_NOCCA
MRPLTSVGVGRFDYLYGSFFIDEEEKVAVVFDVDGFLPTENPRYHTALIIGEEGYFKSVSLGEAPNIFVPRRVGGYVPQIFRPPLVCSSSYLPSLVQINQPRDDGFRFVSCKSSKC